MKDFILVAKALSDETRVRILNILVRSKAELCICEIMDALNLAHYNISRHMKELRVAGLVRERKEGKFVFYCAAMADTDLEAYLRRTLESMQDTVLIEDSARLQKRLSLRENGKCVIGMQKDNTGDNA